MAKKNKKNKTPAKPRNQTSCSQNDKVQKQKKKLRYDFTYPEKAKFLPTDSFLNCYNFIPLPSRDCIRTKTEKGSLTGSIHCTITPKTDIFIPNTSNTTCQIKNITSNTTCQIKNISGDTVREFFSYTELGENYRMTKENAPSKPVIPGSELRGMIRSMYEAFTDSCMSALDFGKPLSARVTDIFESAVLIFKQGKWSVYKAKKYYVSQKDNSSSFFVKTDENGKKYILDDNGEKIYSYTKVKFSCKTVKNLKYVTSISQDGNNEGYLLIGEPFTKKNNEFIFIPDLKNKIYVDNDTVIKAIERYNSIIKDFYTDGKVNKTKETIRNVADFYKGRDISLTPAEDTVIPVWYHTEKGNKGNQYFYLSPSSIGREIFVNDILKFTHTYDPCQGENLCPCCQLFGMVGKEYATGSRLRFSDAVFTGKFPKYAPITTLKELATPKPTSMATYTHRKDEEKKTVSEYWNYDIYKTADGKTLPAEEHIDINGRKMYYHHPNAVNHRYYEYTPQSDIAKNKKRLITVRPLKGIKENTFAFDIFFEHLREDELKMLLVVTSLMFNPSDYCYKIGMGKPIGLGSIKISVDSVKLRTIALTENGIDYTYQETEQYRDYYDYDENTKETAEQTVSDFLQKNKMIQSVFKEIEKMTYFNYADSRNPQYPTPKRETEIFKWFSYNSAIGRNNGYRQVLKNSGVLEKNEKK